MDLAPLKVFVRPGMQFYDITLFVADAVFPLPGSLGPFKFWPDNALDELLLEGTGFAPQGLDLSLQEYVSTFSGGEQRTVKLAFFSGGPTSTVIAPTGTFAELTALDFILDVPADMFNSPVVRLERAALRISAEHPLVDPALAELLPRACW